MAILRDYAARTAVRTAVVLVANGPVHHRGGRVHRRLRDALYELTALCRTHPRAHILTLLTDPAIRWPRRQEFERGSLSWPEGTDHGAIELAIFDERPPLVISVFQRVDALPHPHAHAICYHRLLPPQMPAADFAEWRGRPFDVVYVGNDRTVARRKQNAHFLSDPRLATLTYGLSAKHCAWPNHVAAGKIPMEEVVAVHTTARCCLVTCDPGHTSLQVGYTIRVVQGLASTTLCAFHPRFPVERVFRGLEGGDLDLAAELVLQGPDELVCLLEGMTAERYAAFVRVQHLAARRCRDAGATEDPGAQLLQITTGAHAASEAECGEQACTRTRECEVRPDS